MRSSRRRRSPSSEHSNVVPPRLAEKANEASVAWTVPDGPESIVVSGGSAAESGEQSVEPLSVKVLPSWPRKRQS